MVDCDKYFKVTLHDGTIDDIRKCANNVVFNDPCDGFLTFYDINENKERQVLTTYAMSCVRKIDFIDNIYSTKRDGSKNYEYYKNLNGRDLNV